MPFEICSRFMDEYRSTEGWFYPLNISRQCTIIGASTGAEILHMVAVPLSMETLPILATMELRDWLGTIASAP